jgi:hypothetical protein
MAIPVLAVLGILTTIESVIQHSLVKRLLVNISKGTKNRLDDLVILALYGVSLQPKETQPAEAEAKLLQVQEKYDAMTPEEKAAAKELRALSAEEMLGEKFA